MGTRVNKVIGYGFKDIKRKGGKIIDSRFNLNVVNNSVYDKLDDFGKFIKDKDKCKILMSSLGLADDLAHLNFILSWANKNEDGNFYDCYISQGKVMMFVTPEERKYWFRHDDIIDYTESFDMNSRCIDLLSKGVSGISPFGGYICKPWKKTMLGNTKMMSKSDYEFYIRNIIKPEVVEHLKNDWCLEIPLGIRLLTAYLGVFKDPKTVMELRPLVFKFWR